MVHNYLLQDEGMDGYSEQTPEGDCPLCVALDVAWHENKLCIGELCPLLYFARLRAVIFLERKQTCY